MSRVGLGNHTRSRLLGVLGQTPADLTAAVSAAVKKGNDVHCVLIQCQGQVTALQTEVASLNTKLSAGTLTITELQTKLAACTGELSVLKTSVTTAINTITAWVPTCPPITTVV